MTTTPWASFQRLTMPQLPDCPWATIKEALIDSSVEFFERSKAWRTEPAVEFDTVVGQSDYAPTLPGKISRVTSIHKVGGHYLQKIRRGYIEPWQYRPVLIQGAPNTGDYRGPWLAAQSFKVGEWITRAITGVDGIVFECVAAGVSGGVEPSWPTVSGNLIVDNGVTWRVEYVGVGTPREYLEKNDTTITIFPAPDAVITMAIDCSMVPNRESETGIEDYLYQSYAEYIASGAIYRLASTPLKNPWTNVDLAAYHQQRFERGIDLALYRDMQGVAPRARPRMF